MRPGSVPATQGPKTHDDLNNNEPDGKPAPPVLQTSLRSGQSGLDEAAAMATKRQKMTREERIEQWFRDHPKHAAKREMERAKEAASSVD